MEADAGLTETVVTTGEGGGGGGGAGAVTVMVDVPVLPEFVAVIVAEPAEMPLTTPELLTEATAGLLLDHVTVCPAMAAPF